MATRPIRVQLFLAQEDPTIDLSAIPKFQQADEGPSRIDAAMAELPRKLPAELAPVEPTGATMPSMSRRPRLIVVIT